MPRADHRKASELIAVVGDVHGHLQLALAVLAEWQEHLGVQFAAVCLCGDVGTFTAEDQLDNATRRHARSNPCELEFLHQWAVAPQPSWIEAIFQPRSEGGLGLQCPVIMVHGNHEGFSHLERLVPSGYPHGPVPVADLPAVDSGAHLRLLPSGWVTEVAGHTVAAIGGIEPGQRAADYHKLAYIDEEAVLHLLGRGEPADLLITHQGPARTQGEGGSPTLDLLLERTVARVWCHGHSVRSPSIRDEAGMQIVPLHDVAFGGLEGQEPGADGWALVQLEPAVSASRETPFFLRSYRRTRWATSSEGQLVTPPLAHLLALEKTK